MRIAALKDRIVSRRQIRASRREGEWHRYVQRLGIGAKRGYRRCCDSDRAGRDQSPKFLVVHSLSSFQLDVSYRRWPWGRVLIARDRLLLLPNVGLMSPRPGSVSD